MRLQQQPLLLLLLLSLQGPLALRAAAEQLAARPNTDAAAAAAACRASAAAAAASESRRCSLGLSPPASAATAAAAAATSPRLRLAAIFPFGSRGRETAAATTTAAGGLGAVRPAAAARLGLRSKWGLRRPKDEAAATAAEAAAAEERRPYGVLLQRAKKASLLLYEQVCMQLRQHEPELRVVGRSLGRLALQCMGSLMRMHLLSAAVLLPLCTSWGFAEPLARVKLDDPFLLQQLRLPAGATPALYGLTFNEVTIPTEEIAVSLSTNSGSSQPQQQQEGHADPLIELQQEESLLPAEQQQQGQQQQQQQEQQQQQLRGWLVPAEQRSSKKAIVCMHGWLSNRQACLPFLQAAKQLKLHRDHHILLLDLRGSGDSPAVRRAVSAAAAAASAAAGASGSARSAAAACASGNSGSGEGWAFEGAVSQLAIDARDDLRAAMRFLASQVKATDIGVYAQGGAAMGVLLVGADPDWLDRQGASLQQVLLDSPICSARSLLQQQPSIRRFARSALLLLQHLAWGLGSRRSTELRRLRACLSLGSVGGSKTTLVASKTDALQVWPLLLQQLLLLEEDQRPQATYVLESGSHCGLAAANAAAFEAAVANAFVSPGLLQRLWRRMWGFKSFIPNAERLTPKDLSNMREQQQQVHLHQQLMLQQERQEEEEEMLEARDTDEEMEI